MSPRFDTGSKSSEPRLAAYTTFRLGGPCRAVVNCATKIDLLRAIETLAEAGEPFLLIGGGSNLLVSDEGVDSTVVRYVSDKPLIARTGNELSVQASTSLDELVVQAVQAGLDGLTCCTGIPGTVGGAIAGNAGAFGEQIADHLTSVSMVDAQGHEWQASPDELNFGYRTSRIPEMNAWVTAAKFRLKPAPLERLRLRRQEILEIRLAKHPDWHRIPTAGSFFKNIEPTSKAERRQAAGWFLEQAGAKSLRVGGARTYEKHANIIIAEQGCTAADVFALSREMARVVRERFGIHLHREVRLVGRFAEATAS